MGMLKSKRYALGLAAFVAGVAIAASGPAVAAKKMTYNQAYAACKKQVDKAVPKSGADYEVQRATAGGACMKKLGFKLKNPAEF